MRVTNSQEELEKKEVEVKVTQIEKNKQVVNNKGGRTAIPKSEQRTNRIFLGFTDEEIFNLKRIMKLEGIEDNKYGLSTLIRKLIAREMLRSGFNF
ncbi:hypothetical protein ACOAK2_12185 (plasmid) [Aliarcobacter butzleri]|uniref:hypothetical protein n=1 Tax=Aliarcobacter butzleri TaxID=28197 RepID=UPI003B28D777